DGLSPPASPWSTTPLSWRHCVPNWTSTTASTATTGIEVTTMYPPHADHRDKDEHLRDRTVKAPAPVRYRLRPVEFDVRQMPTAPEVDLEEIRSWCNGRHEFLDGQHCIRMD